MQSKKENSVPKNEKMRDSQESKQTHIWEEDEKDKAGNHTRIERVEKTCVCGIVV